MYDSRTTTFSIRAKTIIETHNLFYNQDVNILAGLKPKLLDEIELNNNDRIIDKPFTFIKQSVGIASNSIECINFVNQVIDEAIKSGYVKQSLKNLTTIQLLLYG